MKGSMILLLLVAFLCACFTHGREHETQKLNHVWSNAMSTSFSAAEVSEAGNAIPSVFGLQGIPEKLIAVHLQEQIKQNVLGHSEYVEVLRRLIVEHTLARPHIYVTTESVDSLVSFMAELLDLHVPVHVHYYSPATHGAADKPVSGHHWKLPNTTHEHTSGLVVNGHHAPQQDRSKSHTIKHSLVALLLTMEASYYITPRREHNVRSRLIHELRREVVDVDCGNCTEGFEVKTNHHAVENSTVHEAPSDKMDFSFDPVDRSEEFRLLRGDNTGLRVLIVSVDNRHLAQDYLPLTAVLRYNYCKQHGYGYVSVRDDTVASLRGLKERYAEYVKLDEATFGQSKYGHSNFHPGLKQFRSSAFAKVPSLWYLHQRYGAYFDYIMFQDSDAAPNPTQENRSVGDALNEWSASNTSVMRGVADPREADFIFFNNFPWRDDLPCTGTFLLKSSEHAEVVLREWWDYDLPQKNFVDFMEQDPLWYSLEAPPEMKFEMNFHRTATLLNEKQIPSKWYSINDLWLVHVPNYEPNRFAYFRTMVKMSEENHPHLKGLDFIVQECELVLNTLAVAELMETRHIKPYRAVYPTHFPEGRPDDNFHAVRVAKPPLPAYTENFLDGYVVAFTPQRAIYLMQNGTKRAFRNMDTFENMGYKLDMVLRYSVKDDEFRIPTGPNLPNK